MAEDFILDSLSDMDPYDREERCRKTIRTLLRAIIVRIAAGVLLAVAVVRAGVSSVALGLTGFALVLILSGLFPLMVEMKKQKGILKESLDQQKEQEPTGHS